MSKQIAPNLYNIYITQDDSPTMSLGEGEKMHSTHGAASESLYIYLPVIENSLRNCDSPRVLSMGLGLGYNEWLALGANLKAGLKKELFVCSFESVDCLREDFINWLGECETPLYEVLNQVLEAVASRMEISSQALYAYGQQQYRNEQWLILGALPSQNPCSVKFNGILYDAFSGQSDRDLWQEDYLKNFLEEYSDQHYCELTTYAATGNLNRALKAKGFSVKKLKGFGVKRESTWALRGSSPSA